MPRHVPKAKQSYHLGAPIVRELRVEAERLDRPLSWLVQFAWKQARADIAKLGPRGGAGA